MQTPFLAAPLYRLLLSMYQGIPQLAQDNDPKLKEVISVLEQNGRPPTSCATGLQQCFRRRYTSCTTHLSHIQVVVPPSLYSIVLRNLHNQAGHLGVKRTTDMVKSRFYWPGYEFDIAEWVRTCQECQKRNPPAVKPRAPLGTLQATYIHLNASHGTSWAHSLQQTGVIGTSL